LTVAAADVPADFVGRCGALDLARLRRVADALVGRVPGGVTFGLVGTLGVGKTRLTQTLGESLGIDPSAITSPTFTLVQSHDRPPDELLARPEPAAPTWQVRGRETSCRVERLHHADAYRLSDEDEFLQLGVEELFEEPDAWTVVEWADRVAGVMPADTAWVRMGFESDDRRRTIEFYACAPQLRQLLLDVCREIDP
jgi:tRNA threonylcarbamoyladenosine biosynthesis protein TsaE